MPPQFDKFWIPTDTAEWPSLQDFLDRPANKIASQQIHDEKLVARIPLGHSAESIRVLLDESKDLEHAQTITPAYFCIVRTFLKSISAQLDDLSYGVENREKFLQGLLKEQEVVVSTKEKKINELDEKLVELEVRCKELLVKISDGQRAMAEHEESVKKLGERLDEILRTEKDSR